MKYYEQKTAPARLKDKKGTVNILHTIKSWQEDSENFVGTWSTKQEKWHKLRMRIKKVKTFPWPGCSNLRMPTLDTKIRKLKAQLMNGVFGVRPVVQAIPSPEGNWETAKKIEKFIDHLVINIIKIKNNALIAIDQTLEKGFYLLKPYWRTEITTRQEKLNLDDVSLEEAMWLYSIQRTPEEIIQVLTQKFDVDTHSLVRNKNQKNLEDVAEKILSGNTEINLDVEDVLYNFPDVSLCPPERTYVPTVSGYDPQKAQYIIHEFYQPLGQIKRNAVYKNWDAKSVEKIDNKKEVKWKNLEIAKGEREGIQRLQTPSELVKIWECYCWFDINNDGLKEKCIVTIAPDFDLILRKITLPFFSGKFPFIKLFYELTDDRWFAHRGLPEIIEDIVKEIDVQHMQKLDSQTIRNAPMFVYRAGQVNPQVVQFVFGQGIAVGGSKPLSETIQPFNNTNPAAEMSYEREQVMLETTLQEITGTMDFTVQSAQQQGKRTASEVQIQQQRVNAVFSLDADMFREAFGELFNWIWELWCQYGDEEYQFRFSGEEPIKLRKEEIQGKYKIVVRGNDQNVNPQLRLQKAQTILQGMSSPLLLQTGLVNPVNIYNAYKRFYQELDVLNWEELITEPKQVPQQPQPIENMKTDFKDLTPMEQAQVLQRMGIKPDLQGKMLKKKEELEEKDGERLSKGNSGSDRKMSSGGR